MSGLYNKYHENCGLFEHKYVYKMVKWNLYLIFVSVTACVNNKYYDMKCFFTICGALNYSSVICH